MNNKHIIFVFVVLLLIPLAYSSTVVRYRTPSNTAVAGCDKTCQSYTGNPDYPEYSADADTLTRCLNATCRSYLQEGQYTVEIVSGDEAAGSAQKDCAGANPCTGDSDPTNLAYYRLFNVPAYIVNWDTNRDHCQSKLNGNPDSREPEVFLDTAASGHKCCGDDVPSDGGYLAVEGNRNYSCVNDSTNKWHWMIAYDAALDIFHISQGSYDIVSDGARWYACNANPSNGIGNFDASKGTVLTAGGIMNKAHDYICYLNGNVEQFGECIGDASQSENANKDIYGNYFKTGESVLASGNLYFCTSDSQWITDLDGALSNKATCESAHPPGSSTTFKWTGSLCCGDDIQENYNDLDWFNRQEPLSGVGGCFQSLKVSHNTLVSDNPIVQNGDFESGLSYWVYPESISESNSIQTDSNNNKRLKISGKEVTQDITYFIMPDKSYNLKADISSDTGTSGVVSLIVDGSVIASISSPSTGNPIVFTVPGTRSSVILSLKAEGPGFAYFDNVAVNYLVSNLMNFNGSFYGCNIANAERLQYRDTAHGDVELVPITYNLQRCQIVGDYFCGPNGNWQSKTAGLPAGAGVRDTPKYIPEDYTASQGAQTASCCPNSFCWNGTNCVASETSSDIEQLNSPIWLSDKSAYICKDGEWGKTVKRDSWDSTQSGFCPTEFECLVDNAGSISNNDNPERYVGFPPNPQNPQCINNSQFIGDHYCDNGEWTSRTKLIAQQMLEIINRYQPSEYTLYCDYYRKAAFDSNYSIINIGDISNLVRGASSTTSVNPDMTVTYNYMCDQSTPTECVNNFCVLRFMDGNEEIKVLGLSLNKPVNDAQKSFLQTVGEDKTACNSLIGNGEGFRRCEGDKEVWYADTINSVIFSRSELDFGEPDWWTQLIGWLEGLTGTEDVSINNLENLIDWAASHPLIGIKLGEVDYSFMSKTHDYNRIYLSRSDGLLVHSIAELPSKKADSREFIAVSYTGFDYDFCNSVRAYALSPPVAEFGDINCSYVDDPVLGDSMYVIGTNDKLVKSWPDFGAKLRIKD